MAASTPMQEPTVQQAATQVSFYVDWTFWSFVVAGIAVVLSQIPPLRQLLRPAKLVVEVPGRGAITHKVGHPHVSLYLSIRNQGGRQARIRVMKINITREGKEPFELLAKSYFVEPRDAQAVVFVPFVIKPGEEWTHLVNFLREWHSRSEEREYRQLESNLWTDISAKLPLRPDPNQNVEGDPKNVEPLVAWYEKQFRWLPGEYELSLFVVAEPASASVSKLLRFTVFESDSRALRAYAEDFKYGAGIHYDSPKHAPVFVPMSEA